MVHVVEAVIIRYYKVYVQDENESMAKDQALAAAKEMILEGQDESLVLDDGLEIESDDIISMQYSYEVNV